MKVTLSTYLLDISANFWSAEIYLAEVKDIEASDCIIYRYGFSMLRKSGR